MAQYVVTRDSEEITNNYRKVIGRTPKAALFYLPSVGRGRWYRHSLEDPNPSLKLLVYRSKSYAQRVADAVKDFDGTYWKVEEYVPK